jgi:hypothetical protein
MDALLDRHHVTEEIQIEGETGTNVGQDAKGLRIRIPGKHQ